MHSTTLRHSVAVHTSLIFLSHTQTYIHTTSGRIILSCNNRRYSISCNNRRYRITIKNTITSLFLQHLSITEKVKARFFSLEYTLTHKGRFSKVEEISFHNTLINTTKGFMPKFLSTIFQIESAVTYFPSLFSGPFILYIQNCIKKAEWNLGMEPWKYSMWYD